MEALAPVIYTQVFLSVYVLPIMVSGVSFRRIILIVMLVFFHEFLLLRCRFLSGDVIDTPVACYSLEECFDLVSPLQRGSAVTCVPPYVVQTRTPSLSWYLIPGIILINSSTSCFGRMPMVLQDCTSSTVMIRICVCGLEDAHLFFYTSYAEAQAARWGVPSRFVGDVFCIMKRVCACIICRVQGALAIENITERSTSYHTRHQVRVAFMPAMYVPVGCPIRFTNFLYSVHKR